MNLANLRLSPQDEADLVWLFTEWPGDAGLKSSYGAVVNAALVGVATQTVTDPDGAAIGRVHAARRAKRVQAKLDRCPPHARRVLRAAYGWANAPQTQRRQLAELGRLAPVVWLTNGWAEWVRTQPHRSRFELLERLLRLARSGKDEGVLKKIRQQANQALCEASVCFLSYSLGQPGTRNDEREVSLCKLWS